jgi:hypothetical protein
MSNSVQDDWNSRVQQWNDATKVIPALVHEDIIKSKVSLDKPEHGITTSLTDPFTIQYQLGYKDRNYSLSYDVMKRVVKQLSVVAAIIGTRCNQVSSFSAPHRTTKSLGYRISHKNAARLTTKGEREMIQSLEEYISRCGSKDQNPDNTFQRDNFDTFLRKFVRDTLTFDQACMEIVPDKRGLPFEFMCVDASTIRIASKDTIFGPNDTYSQRPPVIDDARLAPKNMFPFKTMQLYAQDPKKRPDYVQIINGQIYSVYDKNELAFCVRNPRTDIYIQGYGYSEIEQLITIITAHLNAEEYNRRMFISGSSPKGILNFKGDNMGPEQIEGFRREWRAQMEGVANSFRLPMVQSEQGVEFISLAKSNSEMEYGKWMDYLLRVTCAVYAIDPEELNFSLGQSTGGTPLFESNNENKLKSSKDKGLKPLLRFIAKVITDNVIAKIDDNYVFDFIGLDELTEQEQLEVHKTQITTTHTVNEIRRTQDLPDIPNGDIILNPTLIQWIQVKMNEQQQAKMAEGAGGAQEAPDQGQQQEPPKDNTPQYSDGFSKSLPKTRILEISLDDWKVDMGS